MNEKSLFERKLTYYNLLDTALKRWYLIVCTVIICLIISIIYALFNIAPTYSCSAKLYIINKGEDALSSGDLSVSTAIANDFEIIINDDNIIGEVAQALDYKYSSKQIKSFISVDHPESTRVIELIVETENVEDSKKIVSSICEISQDKIIDIMGVDRISIISQGHITTEPARSRQIKIAILGFLGGIGASFVLISLMVLTNNRISSAKDIEEGLGLNVLATIPHNKNKR